MDDGAKDKNATVLAQEQAEDILQASISRFTEQVHNDARSFDPSSAWVDVSHVKQADLGKLKLDDRDLGISTVAGDDDDFETEDDRNSDLDANEDEKANTSTILSSKKQRKYQPQAKRENNVEGKKLRPASDILNRLRWDSNLDSGDYVVGYEDRFTGIKELSFDKWKSDQTDREFIPQHRIMYFRKKDGSLVWDRETRKDEIFGSGVGNT